VLGGVNLWSVDFGPLRGGALLSPMCISEKRRKPSFSNQTGPSRKSKPPLTAFALLSFGSGDGAYGPPGQIGAGPAPPAPPAPALVLAVEEDADALLEPLPLVLEDADALAECDALAPPPAAADEATLGVFVVSPPPPHAGALARAARLRQ